MNERRKEQIKIYGYNVTELISTNNLKNDNLKQKRIKTMYSQSLSK